MSSLYVAEKLRLGQCDMRVLLFTEAHGFVALLLN